MDEPELDRYLRTITPSEVRHLEEGPHQLSSRYQQIGKTQVDGREVYLFTFNTLLKDSNCCIRKESRFTYIPEHIHKASELLYVYSGSCTQTVEDSVVRMEEGDLCILDSEVVHSIGNLGENDIVITIVMRKEYLERELLGRLGEGGIINAFIASAVSERAKHDHYYVLRNISSSARHHLSRILCEYFDRDVYGEEVIAAEMVLVFCELLRQYRDKHLRQRENRAAQMLPVLRYIEEHTDDATLAGTAAHFGFSPNYLSERIRHETGRTFKELTVMQRMGTAYFRILNSDDTIAEIAQDVGYENLSYFYRKFKEIYGRTPGELRNGGSMPGSA